MSNHLVKLWIIRTPPKICNSYNTEACTQRYLHKTKMSNAQTRRRFVGSLQHVHSQKLGLRLVCDWFWQCPAYIRRSVSYLIKTRTFLRLGNINLTLCWATRGCGLLITSITSGKERKPRCLHLQLTLTLTLYSKYVFLKIHPHFVFHMFWNYLIWSLVSAIMLQNLLEKFTFSFSSFVLFMYWNYLVRVWKASC